MIHVGRLIQERHVSGKDSTCFAYALDAIGRIKKLTRINGKDSLTTTNSYNIRDWLTAIEQPEFQTGTALHGWHRYSLLQWKRR